jgi:sugar O-acyltransferase (sialic acid O-acetyltransferase NeuD family)
MTPAGHEEALGPWLLYACRSTYAPEAAEIVWRRGDAIHALIDNLPDGPLPSQLGRVIAPAALMDAERSLPVSIPLITPGHRAAVVAEARANGLTRFPPLIDPSAVVARSAALSEGVSINGLVMVAAGARLGRFVLVNRSASIGHDAELHDFVTLGPGCVLAGEITIESGAFVGAGAVLAPRVRVGLNAVIGAGAVVVRDVPPLSVVVGNPARVLRESSTGHNGVSVDADTFAFTAGQDPGAR